MINPVVYVIDWSKLVRQQTPLPLRSFLWLSFMNVLLYPVAQLHQVFFGFRKAKLYELFISPQVCYLERLLNDKYDYTLRRIYIRDGISKPPTYIYQHAELKPVFLFKKIEEKPKFIYTGGESGDLQDDFIIWVPLSINFQLLEMISLVRKFKLLGTKFKIQRF